MKWKCKWKIWVWWFVQFYTSCWHARKDFDLPKTAHSISNSLLGLTAWANLPFTFEFCCWFVHKNDHLSLVNNGLQFSKYIFAIPDSLAHLTSETDTQRRIRKHCRQRYILRVHRLVISPGHLSGLNAKAKATHGVTISVMLNLVFKFAEFNKPINAAICN